MAANDTKCLVTSRLQANWDPANLPPTIQAVPNKVSYTDHPAAFCSWSVLAGKTSTVLNSQVCRAIWSYVQGRTGEVALVRIGNNQFAAEFTDDKEITTIIVANSKGNIKACVTNDGVRINALKSLPDRDAELSPVFAVYLALLSETDIVKDAEIGESVKTALETLTGSGNPALEQDSMYLLNDTLVTGFDEGKIPCRISQGNIDLLTSEQLKLNCSKGTIICGCPRYIASEEDINEPGKISAAEAKKVFESYASNRVWTEEEEKLIPQFPDDYPVMPETMDIARLYVSSMENARIRRPMKNFLWRGTTSYGKSTGVEMLACILHTPLLRVTCSSSMEAEDFLTRFIPDNDSPTATGDKPQLSEIMYDPESAYERITGIYREGVTGQEVLEKLAETCTRTGNNTGARFKLVESNFVTALKNGYICEVQEISRIKDAGTLVSLNEYDREGAMIPLADGTFTRRHRNAMVIYTDNVGYASCRQVDPSVMRRMDTVIDSFELTDGQIRERIVYNTGFDDMPRLNAMMKVWKSITDYCRANDITEGEISVSELERWVTVYMINGPRGYQEGCRRCVVSKASPDRTTQDEIWTRAALPLLEAE